MIEVPRGALTADHIAARRRVLLLRHQRPDADDARRVARRRRPLPRPVRRATRDLRRAIPSRSIDEEGVGELMRIAVERGRGDAQGPQDRHLRRARRRPELGALLPPDRARLRLLLAVPRADRPPGRRAGRIGAAAQAGVARDEAEGQPRRPLRSHWPRAAAGSCASPATRVSASSAIRSTTAARRRCTTPRSPPLKLHWPTCGRRWAARRRLCGLGHRRAERHPAAQGSGLPLLDELTPRQARRRREHHRQPRRRLRGDNTDVAGFAGARRRGTRALTTVARRAVGRRRAVPRTGAPRRAADCADTCRRVHGILGVAAPRNRDARGGDSGVDRRRLLATYRLHPSLGRRRPSRTERRRRPRTARATAYGRAPRRSARPRLRVDGSAMPCSRARAHSPRGPRLHAPLTCAACARCSRQISN